MLLRVAVLFDVHAAVNYVQVHPHIATRPSSPTMLQQHRADNAKIRKAQKNRDYRRKKALQFSKKSGKKPITQLGSDANNDSITIASLSARAGSSGAGASSAGMAPVIAARLRQRQLSQHRTLQEQRSNLV